MADPSVSWCSRMQGWPGPVEPPELLPAEPDPALERLLALCSGSSESLVEDDADASQSSSASEEILSNQDLTLDKAVIARDLLGEWEPADGGAEPPAKRPCRAPPEPGAPPEPEQTAAWRKPVPLGAAHQAVLPAGRRRPRPAPSAPGPDRLLWDPSRLAEHEVERYQRRLRPAAGASPLPDHEQALFQLQECGHDVEEALRRLQPVQLQRPSHRLAFWSDAECDLFEEGLRLYGKDFHAIQRQKVRTRSVGEIVHFYYLWKKTERHRQFLNRTQLDKRKFGLDASAMELSRAAPGAAPSSLQILMAAEPWEPRGAGWPGEPAADVRLSMAAGLLASCPQLLLP